MSRKHTRNDDGWFEDESGSGSEYRYTEDGIEGRHLGNWRGWSGGKGGIWETHDLPSDYDPDND
jgi:hypothetical protein